MRDPLQRLDHIKTRPLSERERADVWLSIKSKLATTPTAFPFSFFSRKVLVYALAFIVIVGTVGASNSARPGSPLFSVDLAVERVESAVDPASRADHARERLAEFESVVGSETFITTSETRQAKTLAPAESMPMAMMAMDSAGEQSVHELPPEIQKVVDAARQELRAIEAEATLKGDAETLTEIQVVIVEFEARAAAL